MRYEACAGRGTDLATTTSLPEHYLPGTEGVVASMWPASTRRPDAATPDAGPGLEDRVIGWHREQIRRRLGAVDVQQLVLDDPSGRRPAAFSDAGLSCRAVRPIRATAVIFEHEVIGYR